MTNWIRCQDALPALHSKVCGTDVSDTVLATDGHELLLAMLQNDSFLKDGDPYWNVVGIDGHQITGHRVIAWTHMPFPSKLDILPNPPLPK